MLDPERQNRFGSSFKVTYPDFPSMDTQPKYIKMYQAMNKHDVVELYYQRFSPFLVKAIKTGVPIQITWNNDKVKGQFVGYTSDVVHVSEQTLKRGIKITCMSSSYVLKTTESKIWKNKTATEIVEEIAKKFKLKAHITPDQTRFTQQSLAGHTYWEKLVELADRIGYGIRVTGAELHFHPIDKMIDESITTIPVMAFIDPTITPTSVLNAQTLDSFTPKFGDYVQTEGHNRTEKVVSGIDPASAKIVKHVSSPNKIGKNVRKETNDPLFSTVETKVVASTQMAKAMADGKSSLSRLALPAVGIGQGDPRIAPWKTIEVKGINDTANGYWVIKSAEHFIHIDGRYQCEFTCATDGRGENKPSATRPANSGIAPTRNITEELSGGIATTPTVTKLSAPATMVTQAKMGYKVTPRRWVGN